VAHVGVGHVGVTHEGVPHVGVALTSGVWCHVLSFGDLSQFYQRPSMSLLKFFWKDKFTQIYPMYIRGMHIFDVPYHSSPLFELTITNITFELQEAI
jgi:hypothetical protein